MKVCNTCKIEKSLSKFYKQSTRKDGLTSQCKSCIDIRQKKYNIAHKKQINVASKQRAKLRTPETRRKYHVKSRYGLTLEQYYNMIDIQNNKCAICGEEETQTNQYGIKNLAVDHNHKTGKVRALLCDRCNRTLGQLNENVDLLLTMVQYIRHHNE